MKKILSLMILGSFTILTAWQVNQPQSTEEDLNSSGSSSKESYYYQPDNSHEETMSTSENASDQATSKRVYEALYGYISVGNQNIAFEFNDGVVTLTGHVNSQEDKDKIENDLKKVEGVKHINNKITVIDAKRFVYYQPKIADNGSTVKNSSKLAKDYGALDKDKKINATLRDKLDSRGFTNVSIITANGVVTLTGTVNSSDEFETFLIEIEKVEGVKKVNNKVSSRK